MSELTLLQIQVLDLLNPDKESLLDFLFFYLSFLGSWKLLVGISALAFIKDRKLGRKLFIALLITALFVFPLKALVNEERPYIYENVRNVGGYEKSNSFPSGHAAFAFAFFVVLSKTYGNKKYFLGLACLIAFSRLYLGQHYPLDVLVGVVLGLFAGNLTNYI